jgi:REP element-mobilizing transposase RayT
VLAYVIMPNHVHLLIEPHTSLERITRGIKGVSSRVANFILARPGLTFWQGESFDHWVRTPAEGEKICRYIENNPVKARLVRNANEWRWSSAAFL